MNLVAAAKNRTLEETARLFDGDDAINMIAPHERAGLDSPSIGESEKEKELDRGTTAHVERV